MHTFVFNNTVSSATLTIPLWQPSDDILINYYTGTSPPYTDPLTRSCSGNRSPISISNVLRSSTVELLFLSDTRAVHSHRSAGYVRLWLCAIKPPLIRRTMSRLNGTYWVVVVILIILQRTEPILITRELTKSDRLINIVVGSCVVKYFFARRLLNVLLTFLFFFLSMLRIQNAT